MSNKPADVKNEAAASDEFSKRVAKSTLPWFASIIGSAGAHKLLTNAAAAGVKVGPEHQALLASVPKGVTVEVGKYAPHYDSVGKIRIGNTSTIAELAHEIGHAKIVGTAKDNWVRERLSTATYLPGHKLMTAPYSKGVGMLTPLMYSELFSDVITPSDKESKLYKIMDGIQRHSGLVVGALMAGPLLHELGASIIGARLAKQHAGQSYLTTAKELVPAFGTYAASALPHIYLSQVAEERYRATHPTKEDMEKKTAGAPPILVLYADDIADLALQGYRMRHVLPFNHKQEAEVPRPVEVLPPQPKVAMMGELGGGIVGAGIGAGLGAFVAGKNHRRLGAALGGIIGTGIGVANRQKAPTYEPTEQPR
jgi:hypothetical protein